jgi:hypothetical protein
VIGNLDKVIEVLEEEFGTPRHGNLPDLSDELIYIKLCQQTNESKFRPMYKELQRRFPGWQSLEGAARRNWRRY